MQKFNVGDKVIEINKDGFFNFTGISLHLMMSSKPDLDNLPLFKTIKASNKNFCCFDYHNSIPLGRKTMPKGMDFYIFNQKGQAIRLDAKSKILHKEIDSEEIKLILKKSLDLEITKALEDTAFKIRELEQKLSYLKTHGSPSSQILLHIENSLEKNLTK